MVKRPVLELLEEELPPEGLYSETLARLAQSHADLKNRILCRGCQHLCEMLPTLVPRGGEQAFAGDPRRFAAK